MDEEMKLDIVKVRYCEMGEKAIGHFSTEMGYPGWPIQLCVYLLNFRRLIFHNENNIFKQCMSRKYEKP